MFFFSLRFRRIERDTFLSIVPARCSPSLIRSVLVVKRANIIIFLICLYRSLAAASWLQRNTKQKHAGVVKTEFSLTAHRRMMEKENCDADDSKFAVSLLLFSLFKSAFSGYFWWCVRHVSFFASKASKFRNLTFQIFMRPETMGWEKNSTTSTGHSRACLKRDRLKNFH